MSKLQNLAHKGNIWNWHQFQKWVDRETTQNPMANGSTNRTLNLNSDTKVFAMGSCFAQNVTKYLRNHGVENAYSYPETIHFNPVSIAQELKHLFNGPLFSPDELWKAKDGRFGHPFRRPTLRTASKDELWSWSTAIENRAIKLIQSADLITITLGGTECWRHPITKKVYLTIPYPDVFNDQMPHVAEFHRISFSETQTALEDCYQIIKRVNPKADILFTVSPNRLTFTCTNEDVVTATAHGKSVLRAALGEWIEFKKDPKLHYFHSYEIVSYTKHPEDLLDDHQEHVNDFAVSVVMTEFMKLYVNPELHDSTEMKLVENILRERDLDYHLVRGRKQRKFKTRMIRMLRFFGLEDAALAAYHIKFKPIFTNKK